MSGTLTDDRGKHICDREMHVNTYQVVASVIERTLVSYRSLFVPMYLKVESEFRS